MPRMPSRCMISGLRYPVSTIIGSAPRINIPNTGARTACPGLRAITRKLESSSMSPRSSSLISRLIRLLLTGISVLTLRLQLPY